MWGPAGRALMTPMSEAARADLYTGLADVLGPERAETLMTHLPRYDPVDVATKTDLTSLESRLTQRFDRVDERFVRVEAQLDALVGRLDRLFRTLVAGWFVIVAAMAGVVFATL
jgi:hypothetical protein